LNADRHVEEIARCQEIAVREFALPEPVAVKQTDYIAQVTQQLGAAGGKPKAAAGPGRVRKRPAQSKRTIVRN
jgi:hypothetical protein